jgi:hypothetical protein
MESAWVRVAGWMVKWKQSYSLQYAKQIHKQTIDFFNAAVFSRFFGEDWEPVEDAVDQGDA